MRLKPVKRRYTVYIALHTYTHIFLYYTTLLQSPIVVGPTSSQRFLTFPPKYISAMETPPPPPPQQQQPRKRGRPKGSTNKPKEDKERDSHPSGGAAATSRKRGGARADKNAGGAVDEKYAQWKSLVPVLYDWFANHNLVWPSLSCR